MSAVWHWKRQYSQEWYGITSIIASALLPEHQEIQRLRKALER